MEKYKEVSEQEFNEYINNYPNKLEWDYYNVPIPPEKTANDFSNGKVWPESVVAKIELNTSMKGHSLYKGEKDKYYILNSSQ